MAPGEQLGVRCLAQGHLVEILRVERVLYIHSPLPDRDSNSQPFDYESDTLTIMPRLPKIASYDPFYGSHILLLEGQCPADFSFNQLQHNCLGVSSLHFIVHTIHLKFYVIFNVKKEGFRVKIK